MQYSVVFDAKKKYVSMQELLNTLWDSTLMEILTLVTSWKAFLTGFLESKYQFVLQIANTIFFEMEPNLRIA